MDDVLETEGRIWVRGAICDTELEGLQTCLDKNMVGERLEWSPHLERAAGIESRLTALADTYLPGAMPVRLIGFNKSPDRNWALPWHQDRVIAVSEQSKLPGFTNFSRKAGVWHCEPPEEYLKKMIFARIHLSQATPQNGCLEIALGSHKLGKIDASDIERRVEGLPTELCLADRGDVIFVKALTLHRSAISQSAEPRTALRIDYAAQRLPEPMSWYY